MGIGVAMVLSAAGAASMPAQIVAIPLAADPVLAQVRLNRPVIVWAFTAPSRAPDLRHFTTAPEQLAVATARSSAPRIVSSLEPAASQDELRLDALVMNDPQTQITGRRLRRSSMAAGLSFKVVQSDGLLSPLLGMSGPVGKALTRIAIEATEPR